MRYERGVRARDVLGPGSPLSERFARYEDRPGQIEMAEAVEEALEDERPLFVEAGTGTGKTLAYLVPAILSGKKVVISTATKALQEQIFTKDIPQLQEALLVHGVTFRAALMKGLSNYICKRRLTETLTAPGTSGRLDPALSRVLAWVDSTRSGDRAELASVSEDDPVWRDVSSGADTRIGAECRFYDECFVTRMRRDAEQASLIVVNHHLFFADLTLRAGRSGDYASAIPAYDAVVFDEAHQLEDIATDFFGSRVSTARVDALVRDASRSLVHAKLLVKGAKDARIASILEQTQAASFGFFRALGSSGGLGRRTFARADYGPDAQAAHGKLDAALETLAGYAEANTSRGEAIALIARRARDLRNDLRTILTGAFADDPTQRGDDQTDPDEDDAREPGVRRIAWLDVSARTASLGSSPIELGGMLRRSLFDRVPTVICTSATLATSSGAAPASFHFAKARLGAPPETRELIVPSPFDFATRAALYLPRDLPEPSDPAFEAAATKRILELVHITGGGAFVLCTSTRAMQALYEGLKGRWKPGVLVQGEAPKHVLLDRFREAEDAVLVATMSFWEGVDVPGRALRLVILDKIPFAVPTDPVVAARSAEVDRQGGNSFAEYSVPSAAITLKQGFGRLLRTQDDAGIVAILDRRIVTKGYGKRLLASLPPARRVSELEELTRFTASQLRTGPP
jgi:ATP-dependent DNA helicase DinG